MNNDQKNGLDYETLQRAYEAYAKAKVRPAYYMVTLGILRHMNKIQLENAEPRPDILAFLEKYKDSSDDVGVAVTTNTVCLRSEIYYEI